jgi:integrase
MKLTDAKVAELPFTETGQKIVKDELRGFFVTVGKTTKTYSVKGDLWRGGKRVKTIKLKVGRHGEITCREARARASKMLGQIRSGEDISAPKAAKLTLRSAWDDYEQRLVTLGRSPKTITQYRDCLFRLTADWLDRSLAEIGDDLAGVSKRHRRITKERGPYMANAWARSISAVYRHARKRIDRTLPEAPTVAVSLNKEHRRNTALAPDEIPEWNRQRLALSNPVRREMHLFILLSGMRPTATINARWEHLNVKDRTLHVPSPKGGTDRAFYLPLSRAMLACLARARRAGRLLHERHAETWIFPADTPTGHVSEWKEKERHLSAFGNDLRQTWRSMAQEAGLSVVDAKLLMNHKMADVNLGYIDSRSLLGHLRKEQEKVSQHILTKLSLS